MKQERSFVDKIAQWVMHSIILKLIVITVLMLLLLIPVSMIQSIIEERKHLNYVATDDVTSKWATGQLLNGPVLSVPLIYGDVKDESMESVTKYWHILPQLVNIDGEVLPRELHRGIYDVVVYSTKLNCSGEFIIDEKEIDKTKLNKIQYDEAFVTMGISDLRGVQDKIEFAFDQSIMEVNAGTKIPEVISSGITVDVDGLKDKIGQPVPFNFVLDLRGSINLAFTPVGSSTNVHIRSDWPSPKFIGSFLPSRRQVDENGFEAQWKVLKINRNFPQNWVGAKYTQEMGQSSFGMDLLLPVNQYQKSTRSVKYAGMTIALTFLIFFLIEVLNNYRIHPLQYILVGLALCLFYTLLVSMSEHTDFDFAYGIATLGIVAMISFYSLSILKSGKRTIVLVSALLGIYGYVYITLQLSDYALLIGSIGLTIVLAVTMYFTRRVNWYELNR